MTEIIFWILAIAVMSVLLINSIIATIGQIYDNKEFKKINEMHKKYLNKMIEEIESEDK